MQILCKSHIFLLRHGLLGALRGLQTASHANIFCHTLVILLKFNKTQMRISIALF